MAAPEYQLDAIDLASSSAGREPRAVDRKLLPMRDETKGATAGTVPLLAGQGQTRPSSTTGRAAHDGWPWSWWWEMGACFISIIACALLAVFLASIDQTSRASWTYVVEPNTLLAIISTVAKTALMVPVVACISQLKWRHYSSKAQRLSDLDRIDRCSRGPWGSFMLLLKSFRANVVISLFALVTIVALGIDSSVQQILETSSREIRETNVTAAMPYATSYSSKAFPRNPDPLTDNLIQTDYKETYLLSSALSSGIFDPPQLNFSCPGDSCSWPDFTTLGVCSTFENVSEDTDRECGKITEDKVNEKHNMTCAYTLPDTPGSDPSSDGTNRTVELRFENSTYAGLRNNMAMITRAYAGPGDHTGSYLTKTTLDMLVIDSKWKGDDADYAIPPPLQAYRATFFLCAQTIRGLRSQTRDTKLTRQTIESEALTVIEGEEDEGIRVEKFRANSTGDTYLYYGGDGGLFNWFLVDWLNLTALYDPEFYRGWDLDDLYTRPRLLGNYMLQEGLETTVANMASTLSTLIQGQDPGDNANATMLEGDSFVTEAYFVVRWPWIVVILVEVLTVIVLLGATIAMTWHDDLPKDSVFAFLMHGLEGHTPTPSLQRETVKSLDHAARGMRAMFSEDVDGVKKFVKKS